jgi:exodeoxyribonuclease-1
MSLVFYDTETTGTDTFFDQILQFAAIRTDADLNEIDRFMVRCRLLPHVVPAPEAMRVNGIKVGELDDPALPSHYEMVRSIRAKLLSWSPALFIGWNSIAFDEDLVRQALYKTLHNPYLTNSNGNTRSDGMRIARACSILAPDVLNVPSDGSGRRTFSLHHVARANGFKHGQKHDAMVDVEATIYLCRLLIEKGPDIWSSFMRFSTKTAVAAYITQELLFTFCGFSRGEPFSCIATVIGQNERNKAEWYVYDLGVHPKSLLTLSPAKLAARLNQIPQPVRRLKSNAAPMLFPAEDAPDTCTGREHGVQELERRAKALQADAALRGRLVSAFQSLQEEYPTSPHIEKQIYDGFSGRADEELMDAFHEVEWSHRNAIVDKFQDPRLRRIGRELIHLERPALLDEGIRQEHVSAGAKRLLGQGEDILWLTLPKALEQIEEMLVGASGPELRFLQEHDQYLRERHKQALRNAKVGA